MTRTVAAVLRTALEDCGYRCHGRPNQIPTAIKMTPHATAAPASQPYQAGPTHGTANPIKTEPSAMTANGSVLVSSKAIAALFGLRDPLA